MRWSTKETNGIHKSRRWYEISGQTAKRLARRETQGSAQGDAGRQTVSIKPEGQTMRNEDRRRRSVMKEVISDQKDQKGWVGERIRGRGTQ